MASALPSARDASSVLADTAAAAVAIATDKSSTKCFVQLLLIREAALSVRGAAAAPCGRPAPPRHRLRNGAPGCGTLPDAPPIDAAGNAARVPAPPALLWDRRPSSVRCLLARVSCRAMQPPG